MAEEFLENTPVDVTIRALQAQVEQLKRIVGGDASAVQPSSDEESTERLKQEIKALKLANEKAEYRIKILLRTLSEKDAK
ncbi:hypothetical protein G6F46_010832 [Rhizopus delemar]|uniref:Uncharacterized protein n=2 Tax=Rhizopus TaxID=4842 RepID=A0A9P6ZB47_9FUNG|nr:hypothetical protein G6F43_010767 [Rhizopus delemar]KAG1539080.1 hypothetical protein G6F51_009359 [Rhizopus arrhizus]KAG1462797.1 hypothetical protein G6F55_002762 [Rhizopus delemar]KAG1500979.1 hypothetical protein G6F54_003345 [Rhizopus delemar]KAG1514642.1 hypothetical protein G6F53_003528 [Rhizopus delemar]